MKYVLYRHVSLPIYRYPVEFSDDIQPILLFVFLFVLSVVIVILVRREWGLDVKETAPSTLNRRRFIQASLVAE